jgi:hypothetical protein
MKPYTLFFYRGLISLGTIFFSMFFVANSAVELQEPHIITALFPLIGVILLILLAWMPKNVKATPYIIRLFLAALSTIIIYYSCDFISIKTNTPEVWFGSLFAVLIILPFVFGTVTPEEDEYKYC